MRAAALSAMVIASGCDHDTPGVHSPAFAPKPAMTTTPPMTWQPPVLEQTPPTNPPPQPGPIIANEQPMPSASVVPDAQPSVSPLEDMGFGIAVDADGNSYVAGRTTGVLEGAKTHGSVDGFVSKWAADGRWLWTQQYGTADGDVMKAIAIAPDGDLVIAGDTSGQMGDDPALGSSDVFLARLDPDGEVRWVKQLGSQEFDDASGLAVSDDGSIYLASIERQNSLQGDAVAVLSRFDGDGTLRWRDAWGGAPGAEALALAVHDGTLYVVGRSNVHFDESFWGSGPTGGGRSISDAFIRRYDTEGQLSWERTFGTIDTDARGVAIDDELAAIVTGATWGTVPPAQAGGTDGFLMRFDAEGNVAWSRPIVTTGWADGDAVALSADGDILVTGNAVGDLDADPATTGKSGFVMRCDHDGEPRWIRQGFAEISRALAAGADGSAHATGWLFDPEVHDAELDAQAFLVRFNAIGTRSLLTWFGSSAP